MADAKAAEQPAQPETQLHPNEVVGIIQRLSGELGAYCNQTAAAIDPNICKAYLERQWGWIQQLAQWQQLQAAASKDKKAA